MGKATQDLRKEHEAISYVLQILDKMMASQSYNTDNTESQLNYYAEMVYFFKIFADKCHHGKEENYLFKELEYKAVANESSPIGALLLEHAQGREYIAQMDRCLSDKDLDGFKNVAKQYGDLLRRHIEKENDILFMTVDQVIGKEEQDLMFEKFEQHEENDIGHGVHEKLHAMIDTWAKAFNVH